ncbi:unnamed protein product, partial [Iphiclides podalirius]
MQLGHRGPPVEQRGDPRRSLPPASVLRTNHFADLALPPPSTQGCCASTQFQSRHYITAVNINTNAVRCSLSTVDLIIPVSPRLFPKDSFRWPYATVIRDSIKNCVNSSVGRLHRAGDSPVNGAIAYRERCGQCTARHATALALMRLDYCLLLAQRALTSDPANGHTAGASRLTHAGWGAAQGIPAAGCCENYSLRFRTWRT